MLNEKRRENFCLNGHVDVRRVNGVACLANPVAPGLCMGLVRMVASYGMFCNRTGKRGAHKKEKNCTCDCQELRGRVWLLFLVHTFVGGRYRGSF